MKTAYVGFIALFIIAIFVGAASCSGECEILSSESKAKLLVKENLLERARNFPDTLVVRNIDLQFIIIEISSPQIDVAPANQRQIRIQLDTGCNEVVETMLTVNGCGRPINLSPWGSPCAKRFNNTRGETK